ncbi:MAG: DUF72 domain-containing protein [Candidatus Helarchaeota archaeon]|nr:DUF72 domain-containing protein [Candidatus Helarchaeota archaeon]
MFPIRLGCSGWSYEDWKTVFYKTGITSKGMLPFYSKIFNTVEINSTFYRLPSVPQVAQSWVKRTPDDFVFAVKFPKQFTHVKKTRLQVCEEDLEPFFSIVVEPLARGNKLGPILIQFPFSFTEDYELLETFFTCLPTKFPYTVEFRHPSWLEAQKKTMDLLSKYNIAYCAVSEKILPPITPITSNFAYIRWHGLNKPKDQKYLIYDYSYTEDQLLEWVPIVQSLADEVKVFGYFNNHPNGQAPANCNQIKKMLGLRVKTPQAGQRRLDRFFK